MPNLTDVEKAERLAVNLARGNIRHYWVVRVLNHYLAVPKPIMNDYTIFVLRQFLYKIGCAVEAEFDHTGKRSI